MSLSLATATVATMPQPAQTAVSSEPAAEAPVDYRSIDHREAMITKHLPLVRYVAGSMSRHSSASSVVDYEDLVGYGIEGLIEAVDTFNPTYNVRFSTWAVMHIRTTIQDALRALDPLPRSLRTKGKEIERVSYDLANRNGYWPNPQQVANELNVPVEKLRITLRDINKTLVSLENVDESHGDDGGYSWLSSLADDDPDADPEASLDTFETQVILLEAVDSLPDRESLVIRMYYKEGQSMRAIADRLGVSESRVSQLHARALKMLRESLNSSLYDMPRKVA